MRRPHVSMSLPHLDDTHPRLLPEQARAKSAEATKMVNEQLGGMLSGLRSSTDSSMAAFAKMEEKVMALEAEAEGAAMVRVARTNARSALTAASAHAQGQV